MDAPIYVTSTPAEFAAEQKAKILALGCSEEYAEQARADLESRAVQVSSSYEGNLKASGKTA